MSAALRLREEWRSIQHRAATDGHNRRELPDDEAIAGQKKGRLGQAQSRVCRFSWDDLLSSVQDNLCDGFKCVGVQMDS